MEQRRTGGPVRCNSDRISLGGEREGEARAGASLGGMTVLFSLPGNKGFEVRLLSDIGSLLPQVRLRLRKTETGETKSGTWR